MKSLSLNLLNKNEDITIPSSPSDRRLQTSIPILPILPSVYEFPRHDTTITADSTRGVVAWKQRSRRSCSRLPLYALFIKHCHRGEIGGSLFEAVDKDIFVLLVRRCLSSFSLSRTKERLPVIDGRKGAIRRRMGQRIGGRDSSGTNETRRSTFRRWLNIFLIGFNGYFYRHNGCFSTAGVLFPFSPCNNNNNDDDILDTIGEDKSLTGEWNFVCKRFLILVRFDCLIIINGRVSRFLEAEWLNC